MDAPCSSDRHLLGRILTEVSNAKEKGRPVWENQEDFDRTKEEWFTTTEERFKREWGGVVARKNAEKQTALLMNATRAQNSFCQRVVYSTCALAPLENDLVIEKVLSARSAWTIEEQAVPKFPGIEVERTRFGYQILPDTANAWGPIYWSVLRRK